jgi:(R,R)-butanediol dehydrogenase / meso-butanediol dehydrogenase / diacetyl reductase
VRAVAIGEDRRLESTELEERRPQQEEVRVEVAFCGICGSDLHFRASPLIPAGTVMGHEFAGTVSEVGEAVEGFSTGDRVAVYPFAPCRRCPNCRRGDYHVCEQAAVMGLGLGATPGAYAEAVLAHHSMLVPMPEELSFEHGALVEPLAVALHGIHIGEVTPEDRCVVIGAGPIGVMCALALEALGTDRVIVVEKNARRRDRMRSLGVDSVGLDDVHTEIAGALGDLPDVVLECAGNPAAPQLAIELVRSRGVIVLLGVLEEPIRISQLALILKEAQIRASFAYRRDEFEDAVELLAAGRLPADRLITRTAPLEHAQEMFERLEDPSTEEIKVLLSPTLSD